MTEHHQPAPESGGAVVARKVFVCTGCDFPYVDQPTSSCDCGNDSGGYIEGIVTYPASAPVAQEPVHQYRVRYRADWYDGHPDTSDGKDYETRTLYASTVATQAQPKRRPYNASGSLSEYGVFPECDAQQPVSGADGLIALVEYLRQEADFNRSWVDGRRGATDGQSPEYTTRRTVLAARADTWADAVSAMMIAHQPAAQPQPSGNAGELPPLPNGYVIQMTPDPDSTPAEWFDETDMRNYARAALAAQAGGQTQLGYTLSDVHEAYSRGKAEGQTSGEDREDAERYRHLRDHSDLAPHDVFNADWLAEHGNPETLDAAIDASRRES